MGGAAEYQFAQISLSSWTTWRIARCLFDRLVGNGVHARWNGEVECVGDLRTGSSHALNQRAKFSMIFAPSQRGKGETAPAVYQAVDTRNDITVTYKLATVEAGQASVKRGEVKKKRGRRAARDERGWLDLLRLMHEARRSGILRC